MKMNKVFLVLSLVFIVSCGDEVDYYPKPSGYLRMDFPERVFTTYTSKCAYSFEMPDYFSVVDKDSFCNMKDIVIERFNASLLLTYIPVDTNLVELIERSRSFVYEHSQFADAIEESVIIDKQRKTYGLRYSITGNAASPYQFYLTDSTSNFIRGALYFNAVPNYDSIKPSLDYVVEDIDHILETLIWKSDLLE